MLLEWCEKKILLAGAGAEQQNRWSVACTENMFPEERRKHVRAVSKVTYRKTREHRMSSAVKIPCEASQL